MPMIWSEDIVSAISMKVMSACISQEPPSTSVVLYHPEYCTNVINTVKRMIMTGGSGIPHEG